MAKKGSKSEVQKKDQKKVKKSEKENLQKT